MPFTWHFLFENVGKINNTEYVKRYKNKNVILRL